MGSNSLLSIIFSSEVRKEVIFHLLEKPMTLSDMKIYFSISSPEIIPRLKELQKNNIIYKEDNEYKLTEIGRIIAINFKPLLNTLDAISCNEKFWKEHNLESIPNHILMRLGELQDCAIIEERMDNIHYVHEKVFNHVLLSNHIKGISSILDKNYPKIFLEMAKKNKKLSIILTDIIFNKVKNDYPSEFQAFLSHNNTNLYVLKENIKIAFIVTDVCMALSLPSKNDFFDVHCNLMSFNKSSLNTNLP
jgi:predicted transcriptional regulator